jgi:hypothetical protein
LGELLANSQEGGRFFASPQQISLHNYTRHQYFEDKHRMRVGGAIIDAYKGIFSRIAHIEDLVYFIDFVLGVFLREHFEFVETRSRDVFAGNDMVEQDLDILKLLPDFNEEDRLTVKYCFYVGASTLLRKSKLSALSAVLE